MGSIGEWIRKDALLDHIKDLPTWDIGKDGDLTKSTQYPEGYFYPEDVISSIEVAPSLEITFNGSASSITWRDMRHREIK